ncbi:MAG: UDP-2,3-diacylglucosamine diphosphatase [Bacteroidia bacterium]
MKKVFFASDFHLGTPSKEKSEKREKLIIQWLNMVKEQGSHLFLVGDLFDFWHDYKHVVPKGFISFQAKIKELVESGIEVHFFTGNHDLWMFGYFSDELGVKVHKNPISIKLNNKSFYIAHGDGLGPGDHGYKFIKKVFTNKICQFLFRWFHPDLGVPLASYLSRSSRENEDQDDLKFLGEEKEWLIIHSKEILRNENFDFMVYGHRHVPIKYKLNNSLYINLGDWISNFTFGEYFNGEFELKRFKQNGTSNTLGFSHL